MVSALLAVVAVFLVSDTVYTVDHYFVHHDRARYRATHSRHHRRYVGARDDSHLDAYEVKTYSSAFVVSVLLSSLFFLFSGNVGFLIGPFLKYAHSLLFHVYQHGWWNGTPVRKQELGTPRRTWGIAHARYHAFHHSDPNDPIFTYAESWAGLDRLLELAHPFLYRFTVDGAAERKARQEVSAGATPPRSGPGTVMGGAAPANSRASDAAS